MAEPLSGFSGRNGTALGDVTPVMIDDFRARYESYLEERKAINKVGKDLRGDIEKAGVPLPAWDQFIKLREEAGVVRERNDAAYRQLMAWDLKPVGLQSQMDFATGGAPDLSVAELKRVDTEGFEAGKSDAKREANPYAPGTEAYQRWDNSWSRGYAENPKASAGSGSENGEVRRGRGRPPGAKNRPKGDGAGAPQGGETTH